MADLMNKYFGNKIYLLPENYETIVDFPSPSDLKKKVYNFIDLEYIKDNNKKQR